MLCLRRWSYTGPAGRVRGGFLVQQNTIKPVLFQGLTHQKIHLRFCQVQCREPQKGQQNVQLYYEDDQRMLQVGGVNRVVEPTSPLRGPSSRYPYFVGSSPLFGTDSRYPHFVGSSLCVAPAPGIPIL